jgi:hypothetical protein
MTREVGQAAIILVLFLVIGASALVYTLVDPAKFAIETGKKTADALAQAKEALIGYAAGVDFDSWPGRRPGDLPCPDTVGDDGMSDGPCDTVPSRIGRLPWKTLGLTDLRDGSGERLWYAVSEGFKDDTRLVGVPLNSETAGEYTVNDTASGTTLGGVIAVLFAPGPAIGGQSRNVADTAHCATTNTTIARSLCADNYLEGGNQDGDAIFTTGTTSISFNDKMLILTQSNFFPTIEMRVARDLRASLLDYYSSYGYYPYAATFTGADWVNGNFRGRIPTIYSSPLANLARPAYFDANDWQRVMVYAVAPRCTPRIGTFVSGTNVPGLGCNPWIFGLFRCGISPASLNCNNATTPSYLTVSGNDSVRAIIMPAGPGLSGQTRPCATPAACLENRENSDGGTGDYPNNGNGTDNYVYAKPMRSSGNNDGFVIVAP